MYTPQLSPSRNAELLVHGQRRGELEPELRSNKPPNSSPPDDAWSPHLSRQVPDDDRAMKEAPPDAFDGEASLDVTGYPHHGPIRGPASMEFQRPHLASWSGSKSGWRGFRSDSSCQFWKTVRDIEWRKGLCLLSLKE